MDTEALTVSKIIFLFGFTLHNIEEAIWLPRWSGFAGRYHKTVQPDQFIFAAIVITMIGYILTAADMLTGAIGNLINYAYLGFVGMMGLNTIFPHLISTIVLKKYAPGLITGLCLNLPFSLIILTGHIKQGIDISYLVVSIAASSGLILFSLKYLFRIGDGLIDFSGSRL